MQSAADIGRGRSRVKEQERADQRLTPYPVADARVVLSCRADGAVLWAPWQFCAGVGRVASGCYLRVILSRRWLTVIFIPDQVRISTRRSAVRIFDRMVAGFNALIGRDRILAGLYADRGVCNCIGETPMTPRLNWASASPCSARRRVSMIASGSCPHPQGAISVKASTETASVVSMLVGRRSISTSDLRH